MTPGERIKKLRKDRGMSQVKLSELINVSKQSLYKYELGVVQNIPYDKVEQIAEVFNTTPAYIMGWEEAERESNTEVARERRLKSYFFALYDRLDTLDKGRLIGSAETLLDQAKYNGTGPNLAENADSWDHSAVHLPSES